MTAQEHMVAIVSFEGAIKREVKNIRQRLADADIGSEFNLTIQASGRVQDGDVKITYKLAKDTYSTAVEGNSLTPTTDEYMRRMGWNSANAPKEISFQEIPF
jgi:hypothetical protein